MTPVANNMITAIGSAFTAVMGWLGEFVSSLVTEGGELSSLLVVFALGIGVTLVHFCGRFLKSLLWGA